MSPLRKPRSDLRWERAPGTGLILPRRPSRERYIEPRGAAQCCCAEDLCAGLCGAIPTASLIADLGAGGWTNGSCNCCDQVSGEYTLDYGPGTTVNGYSYAYDYIYGGEVLSCGVLYVWVHFYCTEAATTWTLEAQLFECVDVVYIHTVVGGSYNSNCFDRHATGGVITLSKDADTAPNAYCSGSFPSTATLEMA